MLEFKMSGSGMSESKMSESKTPESKMPESRMTESKIPEYQMPEVSNEKLNENNFTDIQPNSDITPKEAQQFWNQEFKGKGEEEKFSSEEPRHENIDGVETYYDDNGQIFRLDNELLPDTEYKINDYEYKTDNQGRIESASGQVHLKQHEGRLEIRDTKSDIGKGDEKETDDRGHLIGDQFGGSNGLENMIPQDANINRTSFSRFENNLAKQVKEGREVYVKIEPIYEGDSFRPNAIEVTYTIDGVKSYRNFPNGEE